MKERKKEEHPSYGMLGFYRTSGGYSVLHGSSVKHSNKIRLVLKKGAKERNLNRTWYYGRETLFEVEMSYTQFAELISAMNVGDGIPVTIRDILGEEIEPCPFDNVVEAHREEFEQSLEDVYNESKKFLHDLEVLFSSKKSFNKKEQEEILSTIRRIGMNIGCNQNYQVSAFNEQMENTIVEAKGEIEAFYQNKMFQIAQQALVENVEDFVSEAPPIHLGITSTPKKKLLKGVNKKN